MFARTVDENGISRLVNLNNVAHVSAFMDADSPGDQWHVRAFYTTRLDLDTSIWLAGPLDQETAERVMETITTAMGTGLAVVDLRIVDKE
jgi:hypothetical protein